MLLSTGLALLSSLASLASAQTVDVSTNTGTPQKIASGVIYGEPLNDQLPQHFYTDVGLQYGRAGGAQLPAPNRGWTWNEYPGRFAATLENYKQTRRAGGKFIILPHDVWGLDNRNSSYVWPGTNGDWRSYDAFLNQLISDIKSHNMTDGLVWDIWNEADGGFWNGNQTQWLQLYVRTHKRLRSDSGLNSMQITGPSHAGYPNTGNTWWTNWASTIKANNVIPDQYSWHQEGGGNPADNNAPFQQILSNAGLPQRLININEYATQDEMVAAGYAWYIAKFERLNWHGLLGNWQSAGNLYENLSNLLTKSPGSPTDTSNTNYVPAAGYWIYNYYTHQMTGRKINTTSSSDGNCDVYGTVGSDKVRLLTSCHFKSVNYNIQVSGLQSLGFAANTQIPVNVTRFNSTSNPFDPIPAPYSVGSFQLNVNNGVGSIPVYPVNNLYAYTFEFANPSGK